MSILLKRGATIHYRIDGERRLPAVLLSNSLGTDLSMWDAQACALAPHFHVVRYDTRGHGGSSVPAGPCDIAALGEDALALLDHLDIERAHVVGLSMGGVTAQWLAAHAPGRVSRLVLANTAARIGTFESWTSRARAVRAEGLEPLAASAPQRWFTPGFISRRPETVASMQSVLSHLDPAGYAGCCDALAGADLAAQAPAIAAPTLVIAGSEDPVTTLADAAFLRDTVPGAQMLALQASHLSNVEAESAFNAALLRFLLHPPPP